MYTQQWYMSYTSADSKQDQDGTVSHPDPALQLLANLYDIYHTQNCRHIFLVELFHMD
jgi:hypothetical protein